MTLTESLQAAAAAAIVIAFAGTIGSFLYVLSKTPDTPGMDEDRGYAADEHADSDNWGV